MFVFGCGRFVLCDGWVCGWLCVWVGWFLCLFGLVVFRFDLCLVFVVSLDWGCVICV